MKNRYNTVLQLLLIIAVVVSSIFFQETLVGDFHLHHIIILGILLIETSILSHSIKKTVEDGPYWTPLEIVLYALVWIIALLNFHFVV